MTEDVEVKMRQPADTRPWEVVGIFENYESLQAAIDDLGSAGFARCELSLAAPQIGVQATEPIVKLADDPLARRTDHYCTEALGNAEGALIGAFAVVPALATAMGTAMAGAGLVATVGLVAATGGTGALIGAAAAYVISRKWHEHHESQAAKGGLLLWVGLRSLAEEDKAMDILRRHAAHHIHSHTLPG